MELHDTGGRGSHVMDEMRLHVGMFGTRWREMETGGGPRGALFCSPSLLCTQLRNREAHGTSAVAPPSNAQCGICLL